MEVDRVSVLRPGGDLKDCRNDPVWCSSIESRRLRKRVTELGEDFCDHAIGTEFVQTLLAEEQKRQDEQKRLAEEQNGQGAHKRLAALEAYAPGTKGPSAGTTPPGLTTSPQPIKANLPEETRRAQTELKGLGCLEGKMDTDKETKLSKPS
jgi:hypothetical protein